MRRGMMVRPCVSRYRKFEYRRIFLFGFACDERLHTLAEKQKGGSQSELVLAVNGAAEKKQKPETVDY